MTETIRSPRDIPRQSTVQVHQGDCHVSGEPEKAFSTVLGSCISACVRDKITGVGGMNHFLLGVQSDSSKDKYGESARYGAYAMEELINKVLTQGSGQRAELEIKVFGGGNINQKMDDVGAKNAAFVRGFLAAEGYKAEAEDLGGTYARRVVFQPVPGRVFVKHLDSSVNDGLIKDEIAKANKPVETHDDIELF